MLTKDEQSILLDKLLCMSYVEMKIKFEDKFLPRRGRINCSLNDQGKWRWFGTQFTVRD